VPPSDLQWATPRVSEHRLVAQTDQDRLRCMAQADRKLPGDAPAGKGIRETRAESQTPVVCRQRFILWDEEASSRHDGTRWV